MHIFSDVWLGHPKARNRVVTRSQPPHTFDPAQGFPGIVCAILGRLGSTYDMHQHIPLHVAAHSAAPTLPDPLQQSVSSRLEKRL